jgi:hypothetical protein
MVEAKEPLMEFHLAVSMAARKAVQKAEEMDIVMAAY